MQIIVLGAHRSGTSLATRLVNLLGAYVGSEEDALQAAEDNPKGFWERRDTVACNDTILAAAGCTWDQLDEWSFEQVDLQIPAEFAALMTGAVADLDAHRPWVLKDPRLCLTLPYWRRLLDRPVAVVVARDPCEVATSLRRRNGLSYGHALAIYEYSAVGVLVNAADLPTVRLSYEAMLADPLAVVHDLFAELSALGVSGLHEPDPDAVREFVDNSLYRSRPGENAQREMLTPHLTDLDAALRGRPHTLGHRPRPSVVAAAVMAEHRVAAREQARLTALEMDREIVMATVAAEQAAMRVAIADHSARLQDTVEQLGLVTHERDHIRLERDAVVAERDAVTISRDGITAERDALRRQLDAILRSRYWTTGQRVLGWIRAAGLRK